MDADWVPRPEKIRDLRPCPACLGDGLIDFDRCPECFGAAFLPSQETE